MSLPTPSCDPDPILARIILDVDAQAGELERLDSYFRARSLDSGPLTAAVHYRVLATAGHVYERLYDNRHQLAPAEYLAAHTVAAVMRGIAYGLELAKRLP